jgi:8-oxo-dGTP pyrophosphatase MutT (NUDIX family)
MLEAMRMINATVQPDSVWFERLQHRVDVPPAEPREALWLAPAGRMEATVIGSIEPDLAARIAADGVPIRAGRGHWRIEPESTAAVDSTLAAIANWLHAAGRAAAWRDELLSVTDSAGRHIGAIERAAVRPLGIATHAAHLVACDAQGRVWVQQRAFDKATDPGLWDTLVGGLVAAGESTRQALERETWEEAGLQLGDLPSVQPFGRITVRRPVAEGYMVEHIDMFEAVVPAGLVPANQDGEVERFECLGRADLVARLQADAFTLEAGMILAFWLEGRSVPACA